nr:hypothetical protein Datr000111 [Darna trima granulovirus]
MEPIPSTSTALDETNLFRIGGNPDRSRSNSESETEPGSNKRPRRKLSVTSLNIFKKREGDSKKRSSKTTNIQTKISSSGDVVMTGDDVTTGDDVVMTGDDEIIPPNGLPNDDNNNTSRLPLKISSVFYANYPDNVFVAQIPDIINMPIQIMQTELNHYFQKTLKLNYNTYKLTHSAGDNAVAFQHYVEYLITYNLNLSKSKFEKIYKIMYNMYKLWLNQINDLHKLVSNLNGYDSVKEMMNIINQSVYGLVYFLLNNVLNVNVNQLFFNSSYNINDVKYNNENEIDSIKSLQSTLTALYAQRIQLLSPVIKFTNEEEATRNVNLSEQKLPASPVNEYNTAFTIIR